MKQLIVFITAIILFSSCEKEAEVKLPEVAPKIVVSSFISPQDTTISVRLTKTAPVFKTVSYSTPGSDRFPVISDATVSLSDGEKSVNIPYDAQLSRYVLDANLFPIIEGKEYTLSVTAIGQTVKGKCIVPKAVNTFNFTADSAEIKFDEFDDYSYKGIEVKANWTDIFPNEENYYKLSGYVEVESEEENIHVQPFQDLEFDKDGITKDRSNSTTLRFEGRSIQNYSGYNITAKSVTCSLHHIDSHFYKYSQWLNNTTDDNPFAEPSIVYTNIEGGLGVFAAHNRYSVKVEMK